MKKNKTNYLRRRYDERCFFFPLKNSEDVIDDKRQQTTNKALCPGRFCQR